MRRDLVTNPTLQPVEIPVCFEGEDLAPDLELVSRLTGHTCARVVALLTHTTFRVDALGFSPGFAYLDGLPAELHVPRWDSPRPRVPAGSLGLGGPYAGVYPQATPGGWRLVGRTPARLFDPDRHPPALLSAGAIVRFRAISRPEFDAATKLAEGVSVRRPAPAGPAVVRVLQPGLQTSVQDHGRVGFESSGVSRSGAADALSHTLLNRLLGNPDHAATLEATLLGPTLEFRHDAAIALGGGLTRPVLETPTGEGRRIDRWAVVHVRAGDRLRLGPVETGCRAYIAIEGGVDVPAVLGSRSTHLASGLGGVEGRALRAGDTLHRGQLTHGAEARALPAGLIAEVEQRLKTPTLRARAGPQAAALGPSAMAWLLAGTFSVRDQSDRTGLRLASEGAAAPGQGGRGRSQPVAFGCVQWPDGGEPILLGPDAPPTGGYPVALRVIDADLPRVGQLRPRERVRFELVEDRQADELDRAWEAWRAQILGASGGER
jgi:biotin-dependent carboxylase-like uncharacterized protein